MLFVLFSQVKPSNSNGNLHNPHAGFVTFELGHMDLPHCSTNFNAQNPVIPMGVYISMLVSQQLKLDLLDCYVVHQIVLREIQSFEWESTSPYKFRNS